MRVLLFIILIVLCGCSNKSHTHTVNACNGIRIPVCEVEVQGARTLTDEIEFQEEEMKHNILRSMNLLLDNLLQSILKESL